MMTRKDYQLIADVLWRAGNWPTKEWIVDEFIKTLEANNPRFNPEIFRKASVSWHSPGPEYIDRSLPVS